MLLQVALDGDLHSSLAILRKVHPYVDIAEVGTPLIYREGMRAVHQVHQYFPDLLLLADLKIMDAGQEEARIAFEAGCDLVTVLGVSQDATIQGAVAAAQQFSKQIMVDMMQVSDLASRADALLQLGCDYLCVHTAYDVHSQTGQPSLAHFESMRRALPDAPLAVAGGIGLQQIAAIRPFHPEIVVVGSAITKASDPAAVAGAIRAQMEHV